MFIVCLDLESILIPEMWPAVAEATGIEALQQTTRDQPDYSLLMQARIQALAKNEVGIDKVLEIVDSLKPLEGAVDFLSKLREDCQVIIVTDNFYDLLKPVAKHLGYPVFFCHELTVDGGMITDFHLRQKNAKGEVINAMHNLNFEVKAVGDSYNDIAMLATAEEGYLFNPPENVSADYPHFEQVYDYDNLLGKLTN